MSLARKTIFLTLTLALCLIVFALYRERGGSLVVAFLDVGQGDAIFIQSPTGRQMLVDGGPGPAVLQRLRNVMPFYDRSLDIVLATHPDQDHIGGLPEVLERFRVETIIESGNESDTGTYTAFGDRVEGEDANVMYARRGQVIDLGGGAYARILFPDRNVSHLESNTSSIVMQLIYGETEFLLTGDAPDSIEEYLSLLEGENLRSDVLKLGHHGSRTSSSEIFVGLVAPEFAIVSAGKDNRYGHPHSEVLAVLENLEIKKLVTFEEGTITFRSDGKNLLRN